jgi:hypothetical protein
MATTTHGYNTLDIENFLGFIEVAGQLKRCLAMQRSNVETKQFSGRIPVNSGGVWKIHRMTQVMDFRSQVRA